MSLILQQNIEQNTQRIEAEVNKHIQTVRAELEKLFDLSLFSNITSQLGYEIEHNLTAIKADIIDNQLQNLKEQAAKPHETIIPHVQGGYPYYTVK